MIENKFLNLSVNGWVGTTQAGRSWSFFPVKKGVKKFTFKSTKKFTWTSKNTPKKFTCHNPEKMRILKNSLSYSALFSPEI